MLELRNRKPKPAVFCQSSIINHQSSISAGFTLLELLISLSIVGLILIIVFGALRIGSRAWEKGEREVEAHQRERIVLELVKQQLTSASLQEIKVGEQKPFYLKGNDRSVSFISRVPVLPDNWLGMAYVQYIVEDEEGGDRERLSFCEKSVLLLGKDKEMEEPEEDDFLLLIPGIESLRFEYLKGPEEDGDQPKWQEEWDPETDQGLPLAIRITFIEKPEMPPIRMIARIAAEAK